MSTKISPSEPSYVFAGTEEDLVPADACLLRETAALLRKPVAAGLRRCQPLLHRSLDFRCLGFSRLFLLLALGVLLGVERLRGLRAIPVERDRLETQLPALFVDLLDVLDGRFLGEVDGLRNGAREERLGSGHHVHVGHRLEKTLSDLSAAVRAVEDRKMLGPEVRCAFDRHTAYDDVVELADLFFTVAPEAEQVETGLVVRRRGDAQPLVGLGPDHPGRQGKTDVEDATKRVLRLLDLPLGEAVLQQGLATAMRCAGEGVGPGHVRNDVGDLRIGVAQSTERVGHALVDDLEMAATGELLELHEREVRLDTRGIAVHQEPDGSGRREHRGLRVAIAVELAELAGQIPILLRGLNELGRTGGRLVFGHARTVRLVDAVGRFAVLAHDAKHRLPVGLETRKRSLARCDLRPRSRRRDRRESK